MLLHEGVHPDTGAVVVPKSTFDTMTRASVIVPGLSQYLDAPVLAYGMGWLRNSFMGLDVRLHGCSCAHSI